MLVGQAVPADPRLRRGNPPRPPFLEGGRWTPRFASGLWGGSAWAKQLLFLGMPAPPGLPSPPTRPLEIEECEDVKRIVGRGPIPVAGVGGRMRSGSPDHPT